jgi:hypothetical protein
MEMKNEKLKVKNIEVYNVLGEEDFNSQLTAFNSQLSIDLSSQPNGIYFYRILEANGVLIGEGKIIVQK